MKSAEDEALERLAEEDRPYVCPGCHAVASKCYAGCSEPGNDDYDDYDDCHSPPQFFDNEDDV